MDLSIIEEFIPQEETWKPKNDVDADWLLDCIREETAEVRRFEMVVNEKIAQLQMALSKKKQAVEFSVERKEWLLREYFETVKPKETKTQKSYSLPSGKLVLKKQGPEFIKDDEALTAWVEESAPEYLKIKKSTDWAGLKKTIKVAGDVVVTVDGEYIPGIRVQERPDEFKVVVD